MKRNNIISDELLAAYLEGNVNKNETMEILEAMKSDHVLREIMHVALQVDHDIFSMTNKNLVISL